jgi:hypothetical protein
MVAESEGLGMPDLAYDLNRQDGCDDVEAVPSQGSQKTSR